MVRFLTGKITGRRLALLIVALVLLMVQGVSAEAPPLEAVMVSLDHHHFPFIYLNVAVARDAESITTIPSSSFRVNENGVRQTDYFEVTPPDEEGGVRMADIVFVLDVTGSMGDEIEAVRANMLSFMDALDDSDISYRVGFVVFGDVVYVYNDGSLYADQAEILTIINSVGLGENGIGDGGDYPENQFEAMAQAASMNFRPGTQKVQILLTDAPAHEADGVTDRTRETILDLLVASRMTVFPVFNTSDALANAQYIPIAEATNSDGTYFNILESFDSIVDKIASIVASTYVIRYRSSRPVLDGVERVVVVTVDYSGDQATCEGSYVPGSAPRIQRTQDTLDLHNQSWAAGSSFSIRAEITDTVAPFVQSATLYYRKTGAADYTAAPMTHSSDIWAGTILGTAVASPGVDYYISATDGQSTVTDPSVDPRTSPHQLAILPNEAPQLTHTSPADVPIDTAILITAQIVDTTNALASATLHYRKVGQLIYRCNGEMTNTAGDNYRDSISSDYVTAAGVEYYIYAEDDLGVGNYHGTPDVPHMVFVSTNPPPNTEIETADIDSANGTAKFTWSGSDDTTPAANLVYCYRLVKDSSYSEWSSWSSGKSKEYADLAAGEYKFQVRAKDAEDAIDPSPASEEFTIGEAGNHRPIARAMDISGQPQAMHPDAFYSVVAKYYDPDGRDDIEYCYLRLDHPTRPLTMMWYEADGHAATWAGEEGEDYIDTVYTAFDDIENGYQITWVFRLNDHWIAVEDAIDFGVFATDDGGLESGWDYDDTNASYSPSHPPNPPTALIQSLPNGTAIAVGEAADADAVLFKANLTDPDGDRVGLQVELRRIQELGGGFDETQGGTKSGDLVASGGEATCSAEGLIPGDYHWRARAVDNNGLLSDWVDFGQNPLSSVDFRVVADLGFRPDPDGFGFANFSTTFGTVTKGRREEMFVQYFGDAVLLPNGRLRAAAKEFFNRKYCRTGQGGCCDGFSATSLLNFAKLAQPESGEFSMPMQHPLFAVTRRTRELKEAIIFQQGFWYSTHILAFIAEQRQATGGSPREYLALIESYFAQDMPIILSLQADPKKDSWAHSMVPYRIDYVDPENVRVYVYDSNFKGSSERYVVFNTVADTWSYNEYTRGRDSAAYRVVLPLDMRLANGTLPSSTSTAEAGDLLLSDTEDLLVTNSEGDQFGFDGDRFVGEIPGALYGFPPAREADDTSTWFVPVSLPYSVAVSSGNPWTVSAFGHESMIGVTTTSVSEHSIILTVDTKACYVRFDSPRSEATYNVVLDAELPNSSRMAHIYTSTRSGEAAEFQFIETRHVSYRNLGGETSYVLIIREVGARGEEAVRFTIPIGANATHVVEVEDWDDLTHTGFTLGIDENSDGSIDVYEELEASTVPVLDSSVVAGPNPVTAAGTAFFYTLPDGTSTAKLMIFNITGRLLFETSLDVGETRFPFAGTWNPVDQDGTPLANGPYVYVLIADGKVIGQGKMVIQR